MGILQNPRKTCILPKRHFRKIVGVALSPPHRDFWDTTVQKGPFSKCFPSPWAWDFQVPLPLDFGNFGPWAFFPELSGEGTGENLGWKPLLSGPKSFNVLSLKGLGKSGLKTPYFSRRAILESPVPGHMGFQPKFFPEPPPQKCLAKKGPFSTKFYQKWLGPALGRKFGLKPPFFLGFSFAMCLGTPCAWRPQGQKFIWRPRA